MPHNLRRRSSVAVILHESSQDESSDSSSITAIILSLQNSKLQRRLLNTSTMDFQLHDKLLVHPDQ